MPSVPAHLTAIDLSTIRRHTDWRRLFTALEIRRDDRRSRDNDWWGYSPFKPDERTASFHLNNHGWYCHSTAQGGGVLELVQALHGSTCYDAARWLVEQGISSITASTRADVAAIAATVLELEPAEPATNRPIRQDLRPALQLQHPEFGRRGIPPPVLGTLGAGYLERPPRKDNRPDPMNRRLVFQIRGLEEDEESGECRPVIFGHIGRATTAEQETADGKWWTSAGFKKSLELYNLDRAALHPEAQAQAAEANHILLVEGCLDVAKLFAAGIENVVATFGAHLSPEQVERCELLADLTGVERFLLWYDRDQVDQASTIQAAGLLVGRGFEVEVFDWHRRFPSPTRGEVAIPAQLSDPCDFSVEQLQWLRQEAFI